MIGAAREELGSALAALAGLPCGVFGVDDFGVLLLGVPAVGIQDTPDMSEMRKSSQSTCHLRVSIFQREHQCTVESCLAVAIGVETLQSRLQLRDWDVSPKLLHDTLHVLQTHLGIPLSALQRCSPGLRDCTQVTTVVLTIPSPSLSHTRKT